MSRLVLLGAAGVLAAAVPGAGFHAARAQTAPASAPGGAAPVATTALPLAPTVDTGGFYSQPFTGGLLPNVGTGAQVNDLRPQLERFFQTTAGQPSTTPAWLIQPAIEVDAGVTDNALQVSAPRRADFFTIINPSIVVIGDEPRLKVNLVYSPQATIYASNGSQTRFDQFASGQALAILVPDTLFLDVRGSVTETSLTGNGLQYYGANYDRQNEVTTITFAVTPYAEHRFGGWGTVRLGYSFARTLQDVDNNPFYNANEAAVLGTPGYGYVGNLTTQRERATFTSGENFGRFSDYAVAEAVQYSGGGSYRGAYRNEVFNEVGYALTRRLTLLAGFGYQDLRYAGLPPVRINEPIWNFGARYTPNPDTTLTVLYGRHDGISSISFDGQWAPTPRTRLIGRYSTGITSDLEESQAVLDATTIGSTGLVTDAVTGVPLIGGSFFGIQDGVYKVRRLSVTGLLLQERDSYSAGVVWERRTALTTTPTIFNNTFIPAGTTTNSVYGTVSWQHELSPSLNSVLSAQYGVTDNTSLYLGGNAGTQTTFSFIAALNKRFTETLTGSVRYIFTDQSGGGIYNSGVLNGRYIGNTGSYTQNTLLVGLRKTF